MTSTFEIDFPKKKTLYRTTSQDGATLGPRHIDVSYEPCMPRDALRGESSDSQAARRAAQTAKALRERGKRLAVSHWRATLKKLFFEVMALKSFCEGKSRNPLKIWLKTFDIFQYNLVGWLD